MVHVTIGHYDRHATLYDSIMKACRYSPTLKKLLNETPLNLPEKPRILDMGCGTGLVGQYLKERGFKKVVGVDASKGMLDKAAEKNSYSELKELFLGLPDTFPREYHNRFDAITAAGILAEGHLDNKVFDEMLLSLKTGGYAIFATRTMYLTQYNYADRIRELTE